MDSEHTYVRTCDPRVLYNVNSSDVSTQMNSCAESSLFVCNALVVVCIYVLPSI